MEKLLNQEVSDQIKELLSGMKDKVTMVLFTQEGKCETCKETRSLLHEVAELNSLITVTEKDLKSDASEATLYGVDLAPSFVMLDAQGNYTGVKFNGIPAGHEINSFLSAIMHMSGVELGLSAEVIEQVKKIDKKIDIKVFVTLSCPHCPGAVETAHKMAMLNENIEASMIEAQTFFELSNKYNVSGVPKIIINETHELVGNQPIEAFLKEIEAIK